MKDHYDPWYVRLPDGRTIKAKSTASVRHHVEAGHVPLNSMLRRDPDARPTGRKVLRRIEYVIDKRDECKVLLGNPFILRSVEKLMGPDLIPTWDSMDADTLWMGY